MKTNLIKIITVTALSCGLTLSLVAPTFANSCTDICNCPGVSEEIRAASGCPGAGTTADLPETIRLILNSIILVSSTIAVIFIIIGGIQYMTSTGEAGKVKKAKDTILYACIGLAVCALSFMIVNFAINAINASK